MLIYIAFNGQLSKDLKWYIKYFSIHREKYFILIKDHFSGYMIGNCLKIKSSQFNFICNCWFAYCPSNGDDLNRYVHLYQGKTVLKNPKVRKMFEKQNLKMNLSRVDANDQNGQVKWAPKPVANIIRAFSLGASLWVKLWPYEFHNTFWMKDVFPSHDIQNTWTF